MRDEAGQATVEWVALVLVAALALGALAGFRAPAQERGLGETLARRLTCAAGGSCAGASGAPGSGRGLAALPRARRPREGRAIDAVRRLRGVGELSKRIWIVCLGYRRLMKDLDDPRAPTEAMPLDDAIEVANDCLNPAAFLGDED